MLICLLRLGVGVWPAESELEDFCFLFSLSWGCWLITGLPGSWSGTAHDSVLVSSSLTGELLNLSPVVPEFNLGLLPFDLSWENGLMAACQSLPSKPYVSFRGFGSLRKKHFAWANLQHVHCMWKNTVTATEITSTVLLNLCKKQTQLCRDSSLLLLLETTLWPDSIAARYESFDIFFETNCQGMFKVLDEQQPMTQKIKLLEISRNPFSRTPFSSDSWRRKRRRENKQTKRQKHRHPTDGKHKAHTHRRAKKTKTKKTKQKQEKDTQFVVDWFLLMKQLQSWWNQCRRLLECEQSSTLLLRQEVPKQSKTTPRGSIRRVPWWRYNSRLTNPGIMCAATPSTPNNLFAISQNLQQSCRVY